MYIHTFDLLICEKGHACSLEKVLSVCGTFISILPGNLTPSYPLNLRYAENLLQAQMPEICQHFSILPKQKHMNGETADCSWDPMNTRSLLTHTACLQQLCSAMTPSYFRLITAFSVTFQLLLLNSYLLGIFGFQAPTS